MSLHDNDIIQQELNYFVNHTIRDSLEKRLSDTIPGGSVEKLEAAGILTLGAAGGAAGGPIGAVLGLSVGAFGSMIIDAALTDGERDTRNAVKRMYQQYGDNWDEYAQKSTRLYFRSVLQALPENTAPDFIGLHTYPIDLVKKQGLAAMQDDIDELVTGLQLEWVERFAPGDLARLQAMVSANVRADLTAEEVTSFQGVRNVPPVLITEFGNISPEIVALRDVKDTLIIQRGMGSTFSDPDLAGNFDGSTLFLCTRTMYGRSSVQLNDLQTDYGEITLMNKEFGKLKRYGTVSSSARLSMLMDMQNYSGGQGCSIMEMKNYEFNSSYAKDLTLSMIDRFNQNPNIHAYLLYKPENTDTKFESFGLTPAYSRLFHDLNTTVRGNILAGTPCNDLNDLGQELFKQESGFACRGTIAKRSFASFTQPVWTSEAKVEPSTTIRPTGTAQALWVGGEGYRTLTKAFTSTEVRDAIPGVNMAVDIFIPNAQKNPWWVGDVQLYWNAPSANVYNQYLGRSDLTQLPRGNYSTISFSLPGTVQNLLANLPGDVTFTLALNGDGGFALDDFRFLDGQPASFPTVRATERILAMDNVDDWTSENAALRAIADREDVVPPVLHVSTNGWTRIASAEFDQSALKGKNAMQVDVLIPEGGNAYWSGDLAASLNCPGVGAYSVWLGRASFQNATKESWQTMEFMIPESISQIDHPSAGCRLFFDLNANGATSDYQLDRVRFVNRVTTLALGN